MHLFWMEKKKKKFHWLNRSSLLVGSTLIVNRPNLRDRTESDVSKSVTSVTLCSCGETSAGERECVKHFQSKSLRSSHRVSGRGGRSTQNHELDTDREEEERSDVLHICIHPHPHTRTHTKPSHFFPPCLCLRHLLLVLHHVLKQLHGPHHGFILQREKRSNQGTMMQLTSHVL